MKDPRLRLVVGDTTRDRQAIAEAVRDQDFVVSALGRRKTLKSDDLMSQSMRLIVVQAADFAPCVVVFHVPLPTEADAEID